MGNESRKLKRNMEADGRAKRKPSNAPFKPQVGQALPDGAIKSMLVRLGLLLLALWFVGGTIAGFAQSETTTLVALSVPAVLTLGVAGVAIWGIGRARKAQGVAGILAGVETDEDRKQALSELETKFKSKDPAALFARAQLQMQEDPRAALATLEQIDLNKGMAGMADEARAQRGMIHLMLGEASKARDLADGIDLTRHQDPKSRAMMGAVIAEAWARTGQVKKALTTIEMFNPEDAAFEQLRPQLYRARAYVYAYSNNPKALKKALRKLADIDPRMLGGFIVKRAHPLLQREVKVLLEQSGVVQRKVQFQRV